MLDAHPELACTGEHDFLFDHLHNIEGEWLYDQASLARSRIFVGSQLKLSTHEAGEAALHDYIRQIKARGNGLPVLMLHRNLDKINKLFPNTPVVHFLRDPRDVAKSSIGMLWAGNVFYGVDTWLHTENEWENYGQETDKHSITIRYEDLVTAPEATLDAICRHAGRSYDKHMLSYPDNSTYDAPNPSLANQWKSKLSDLEIRLVEWKVGDLLVTRGYKSSGLPPLKPSTSIHLYLRLQNKLSIWRRMISVYGFLPMAQRSVGRRLRLTRLEMAGSRTIDSVKKRRLK